MAGSLRPTDRLRVGVLGLGEAGREIAGDLAAGGHDVRGYDPAVQADGARWRLAGMPEAAVHGCDVVLVLVTAEAAYEAAVSVSSALAPGMLYADCGTADPGVKRTVAGAVEESGAAFADVALLAPVPGRGLTTPALVSGSGADRFAAMFRPIGLPVEVVSSAPGDAAARKLLRSVFMKGMAAALLEAMEGAEALHCGEWLHANLSDELARADGALVERLLTGSRVHARRRVEEMTAAERLLGELSIDAGLTRASKVRLEELAQASGQVVDGDG